VVAKKYYAVKVGRNTGIYSTWNECKEQVNGYPGALYKSFPTETEADNYINRTKKHTVDDDKIDEIDHSYNIYVDGSFCNNVYSWGFAVFHSDELIYTANGCGKDDAAVAIRNVAGELEATTNAIEWAKINGLKHIVIHHDYIGISEWAEGRWKTNNPITKNYADFMKDYQTFVTFKKVPAHAGIAGNELADMLAKEALGIKK
jgi:ribonuclease HI